MRANYLREEMLFSGEVNFPKYNKAEIEDMFSELTSNDVEKHVYQESAINYGVSTLQKDTHYYRRQEKLQDLEAIFTLINSFKISPVSNKKDGEIIIIVTVLKDLYHHFVNHDKEFGILIIKNRRKLNTLSKVAAIYGCDEHNTDVNKLRELLNQL